ncbi:efflux RND transporter periplasmic adaptor subunit [Sphingomonas flavalba]|uniref:efflux RND transporter periplasmic adaptor subunit n=1 Tax=Sphingomonas flavalba TaxID=2559804 RepID=UPI00109DDFF6|nr:efflux RND transporter periplasmic adaptor subunit [Sphingomonas flavalba]
MNYEGGFSHDADVIAQDSPPRRWTRRRIAIVAAIAVVLIAALAFYLRGKSATPAASGGAQQQQPTVTVFVPGRQSVDHEISATGSLAAQVDMPVAVVGEGGMVTRVLVQPGQWVGAGAVLATIERSVQTQQIAQQQAALNVARADARIAQANLDRAVQLVDRGFISKAQVEQLQATRDAANARVGLAQAQLGEMRARTGRLDIRAPAAGLVLTRTVEPGQVVGAGTGTLFRMARGGELELRAQLSEDDMTRLKVGASATVIPVGSDKSFAGRIWQLSPVINPDTRQGIARIALPYDPALRPGGFAQASILAGTDSVPLVPDSAVQSDDKGSFVYIVGKDNVATRRAITVGQVTDRGVSVTSGLDGSEQVVMSAGGFLSPGQKVRPVPRKAG